MTARILIQEEERQSASVQPSWSAAWLAIGWFGLVLTVVALADAALNWYPLALSSHEWEFATIATTYGGLPLLTMGLAALLGSFLARGVRWGVVTMALLLTLLGLFVLLLLIVFALDVPMALQASASTPARLVIRKAVARTGLMGLAFGGSYLVAAFAAIRSLKRRMD